MLSEKTHAASPVPATPSTAAGRRPTTAGYWLAVAIVIAGLVAGLTWGLTAYRGYQNDIDRFARVPATGGPITLTQAGERTIYYESAPRRVRGHTRTSRSRVRTARPCASSPSRETCATTHRTGPLAWPSVHSALSSPVSTT